MALCTIIAPAEQAEDDRGYFSFQTGLRFSKKA